MAKFIESSGYSDVFLHFKEENEETSEAKERIGFPITRYDSLINRPRMITSIADTAISDFFLFIEGELEVSDDTIYEMFGQVW